MGKIKFIHMSIILKQRLRQLSKVYTYDELLNFLEKNVVMKFKGEWVEIENIISGEVNQTQKT